MKAKKSLCLALALLMALAMLAGCTDANNADDVTPIPPTSAAPVESETPSSEDVVVKIPVEGEKIEFDVYGTASNGLTQHYLTSGDTPGMQHIEKLTNVKLNFIQPNTAYVEAFNLMLASQEYPDIMLVQSGSLEQYADDGILRDMTQYVLNDMPSYKSYLDGDEMLNKDVKTDSGRYIAIYQMFDEPNIQWGGLAVRGDMLDDAGLDVPETYDDWYTMLTAFRDAGVEAPLMLNPSGYDPFSLWTGGYGVGSGNYALYLDGGKVKFGPAEQGFKKYLETMSKWYSESLIDRDFSSRTSFLFPETSYLYSDKTGAFFGSYGHLGDVLATSGFVTDPNYRLVGVAGPVELPGGENNFRMGGTRYDRAWGVSTQANDIDVLVKYLDWYFSEEALIVTNYGIEGESFTYVDGEPKYSDLVLHNPDGVIFDTAVAFYIPRDFINVNIAKRNNNTFTKEQVDGITEWEKFSNDDTRLPNISLTAEEIAERSALLNDINTYVSENVIKFITGAKPLSEFDSYVEQIKNIDLDRVLEITQTAVNRYHSR